MMQPNQQLQLLQQQLQLPIGKVNLILPQACNNFIKRYQKNVNIDVKAMTFDLRFIMQQIDIYAQYMYDVITKYQYLEKLGHVVRSVVEGQSGILAFLASLTTQFARQRNLYQKKLQTMTHRIYQRCQNCTRSLQNANIMTVQDQIGLKFRDPLQYFMHDMQQLNKLSQQASLIFRKKMLHVEGICQQQYMQKFQKMYDNVSSTIQSVTSSLNSLTYFQAKFAEFQQIQYHNTKKQRQKIQKSKFDSKKYTLDLSKHFYNKMKKLEDRLNKIRSFFITLCSQQTQTYNQFNQCTPEALSQLRQKILKVQSQKKQVQLYISLMEQQVVDGKLKIKAMSQNFNNIKAQKDKCQERIKMLQLQLQLIRQKQQRNMMIQRLSQKANEQIAESLQTKLKLHQQNHKQSKFSKKKGQKLVSSEQNQSIDQNNKHSQQLKKESRQKNKQIQNTQYISKRQSKMLNMKRQSHNNIFAQKQANVKINVNSSKYSKKQQSIQTETVLQNKIPKTKVIINKKQKLPVIQKLTPKIKQLSVQEQKQNIIQPITTVFEDQDNQNNQIYPIVDGNSMLEDLSEESESKEEDRSEDEEQFQQISQQMCNPPVQNDDYPLLSISPTYQICIISSSIKLCQLSDISRQNLVQNLRILTQQSSKSKKQQEQQQSFQKFIKNIYKRLKQQKYFSQKQLKYQKFKNQFEQFIKDLTNSTKQLTQWKQTKSLSKITQVKPHKSKNKNLKEQFKIQLQEIQMNLNKTSLLQITPKIRQVHQKRRSSVFRDKNIIESCQSAHVQIIKQKIQDVQVQKYKGMLLKSKNKSKIYTQNNYQQEKQKKQRNFRLIEVKQSSNKPQDVKLQQIHSPFNFNLNLRKIHQMKGKVSSQNIDKNDKNTSKNTTINSTLVSPKYMSLSRFRHQKYDLLYSAENLYSVLNSKSYLQNLPHLKKKNREKSLNINKVSTQQQIQYPLVTNQQLSFTQNDVKMIYLSIQNALQVNLSSQKHRKTLSHLSTEENPLYPSQLNYMKQFFTKLANVHLKNKIGYQKIKQFLICPYDSTISQATELSIGRLSSHHSLNSNMMRQALRGIILMHRACNSKGDLCKHLRYFFGKVVSFEENH